MIKLHVNIINTFYEKSLCFSKQRAYLVRRVTSFFTFLQNYSLCDLIETVYVLYLLLQSFTLYCFGWNLWRKFHLTQIAVGKGKSVKLIFWSNCG